MSEGSQIAYVNPFWKRPALSFDAEALLAAIDFVCLGKERNRLVPRTFKPDHFVTMFEVGREVAPTYAFQMVVRLFEELTAAGLFTKVGDEYHTTELLRRRYYPLIQPFSYMLEPRN
jgi:hypothetical protein